MKKIFSILIILCFAMNTCFATNIYLNDIQKTLSIDNIFSTDDGKKANIYFKMAKTYSEANDHENAIKYYTKVIELYPDFEPAYIGRAKDYGDIGNYQGSLKDYETLKKIHPDDPDCYWATSLYKTNIKDLDGAMEDINKAISMVKKPDASYYAQKAWVYLEKEDYENAINWTKKALKQNSRDEYTLGLITVMAFENGRYEDVLNIANESLKYDKAAKQNYVLLELRAKALYYLGKTNDAIKQMDYIIKLLPDNTEYQQLKEKMLKGEKI